MRALLLLLIIAAAAQGSDNSQSENLSRDAFHWNTRIGRGVNLGNALEAPKGSNWGVQLEGNFFKLIAEAGFTSVRIPVGWSAHAETTAPYAIDKAFQTRVDWAIDQALSRDLVAIVNIHHYEEMVISPKKHRKRFLALWKQLAERYRNFPDQLYFEILNEPCQQLTSDLWNQYASEAIQVIRESHPHRAIVVGPARWNNISELKNLKLPPDDKNLIVTYHYYEPFKFTHQGASWVKNGKTWSDIQWRGSPAEKRAVTGRLDTAQQWANANNRPLFMGEFGAYGKADIISRSRWTSFIRAEAEKRKISWAYWEFCAGFGVYDRDRKTWRTELLRSLIPGK